MNRNVIISGINNESLFLIESLSKYEIGEINFIDSDENKVRSMNQYQENDIALLGNPISSEFLEIIDNTLLLIICALLIVNCPGLKSFLISLSFLMIILVKGVSLFCLNFDGSLLK